MKKGIVLCGLLWLAGCLAVGCTEEETAPCRHSEKLYLTTEYQVYGTRYQLGETHRLHNLLLYTDRFTQEELASYELSLHQVSGEEPIELCREDGVTPVVSIALNTEIGSIQLPPCQGDVPLIPELGIDGGYVIRAPFLLPAACGDYDLYFELRHPTEGIKCRTPLYRLSMRSYLTDDFVAVYVLPI